VTISRIASFDTGAGFRVQLDAGTDGSIAVVSTEDGNFLSRLDVNNVETTLAATTTYANFRSGYVETLSDGRYVLYTTNHFGLGWDARFQILNGNGSAATGVIDPSFEHGAARVLAGYALAPTKDGGFAFLWNDMSRHDDPLHITFPRADNGTTEGTVYANTDVRIRYFDGTGAATTPSVVADDDVETISGATVSRRAGNQYINDVAILTGGQTVFAYVDARFVGTGGYRVEDQLSLQIATPGNVGEPARIDLGTFANEFGQYPDTLRGDTGANVVALPNGSFAVIWTEETYVPAAVWGNYTHSGWASYIRYFDASGNALSEAIELVHRDTTYGNHSRYIWAEALPDGRIAFAYNSGLSGVNGNGTLDAYAGLVDALGAWIVVGRINAAAAQNTQFYTVYDLAARSDGTFDVAYRDASRGDRTVIDRFGSGQALNDMRGDSNDNMVTLGDTADFVRLQDGGDDTAITGGGNDVIYYGAALTASDTNDGGSGIDTLVLQGNYPSLTLGSGSLVGIEGISLQSGSIKRWGQAGGQSYDYNLATVEANVAPGQQLRINAQSLRAGEDLVFNGAGETDGGRFLIYAGFGVDTLTGGAGNDIFFFEAGRFGSGDRIDGGGGNDAVVISGSPAGSTGPVSVAIAAGVLSDVEALSFSGRFSSDPAARPSYVVTLANGNIEPGETLIVNASSLGATQTLNFDGTAVADGRLSIFGGAGADTIDGGANGDVIHGGLGGDTLRGHGGADVYRYDSTAESASAALQFDTIHGFVPGEDKIDLSRIDARPGTAGDDAFVYVGGGQPSAGTLSVTQMSGNRWLVTSDVDGDNVIDLRIDVYVEGGQPLTASDFIL
jgi:Ca2+-binding RTX toxin-like protein